MAEYIIIIVIVAILVLVGIRYFGGGVSNQFKAASGTVEQLGKDDLSVDGVSGAASRHRSGGGDVEMGSGSSGSTKGGGSGGGGGRDAKIASLSDGGVGEDDDVIGEIGVDWGTLITIGAIVCVIGVLGLVKMAQDTRGKGKKSKKGKGKKAKPKKWSLGARKK